MLQIFDRQIIRDMTGWNDFLIRILMVLLQEKKLLHIYNQLTPASGLELIEKALEYLDISVEIPDDDYKNIPLDGAFVSVSNHPFGILDGIIILMIIGKLRPHYRLTANLLLKSFTPLAQFLISVNPFEDKKSGRKGGRELAGQHLADGHPLGLFPAGEVSTRHKGSKMIQDRSWRPGGIQLIRESGVPVLPVYFSGTNSLSFHLIGKIHPRLRTIRLPAEFLKKRNSTIKIRIGQLIAPDQLPSSADLDITADFLRNQVYRLADI